MLPSPPAPDMEMLRQQKCPLPLRGQFDVGRMLFWQPCLHGECCQLVVETYAMVDG